MTTIPGYFTLAEAASHLEVSKPAVTKAAKSEGWSSFSAGNTHLYRTEDIREYRDHRLRTRLVKALGWKGRGLYRADDIDIECPICGGFAAEWPAPPEISLTYLCVRGHKGCP